MLLSVVVEAGEAVEMTGGDEVVAGILGGGDGVFGDNQSLVLDASVGQVNVAEMFEALLSLATFGEVEGPFGEGIGFDDDGLAIAELDGLV